LDVFKIVALIKRYMIDFQWSGMVPDRPEVEKNRQNGVWKGVLISTNEILGGF
jgi:hypothetical protein